MYADSWWIAMVTKKPLEGNNTNKKLQNMLYRVLYSYSCVVPYNFCELLHTCVLWVFLIICLQVSWIHQHAHSPSSDGRHHAQPNVEVINVTPIRAFIHFTHFDLLCVLDWFQNWHWTRHHRINTLYEWKQYETWLPSCSQRKTTLFLHIECCT